MQAKISTIDNGGGGNARFTAYAGSRGDIIGYGPTKKDAILDLQLKLIAKGIPTTVRTRGYEPKIDASVYRRYHGAEPRGFGRWTFVMGKTAYEHTDDPALYRPFGMKGGVEGLTYHRAKAHAIAEGKRRGVAIIGVSP